MAEIINQGQVSLLGTTIYTGSVGPLSTKISLLRFYNPLAFVLTLTRYDAITVSTETLYEFNLAAGDTITDNTIYALKPGDQLIVYSNIPGTSYYVYGIDYV
jgi:hypothetical protein